MNFIKPLVILLYVYQCDKVSLLLDTCKVFLGTKLARTRKLELLPIGG